MIISCSRKTDIPAFYGRKFMEHIEKGFIIINNRFTGCIRKVNLLPDNVECFVFWSKNYIPFMQELEELERRGYKFYLNYTINAFPDTFEMINNRKAEVVANLLKLSGKHEIFWRYDPLLITEEFDIEFHISNFEKLCSIFEGHVKRVIVNPLQNYDYVIKRLSGTGYNPAEISENELVNIFIRLKQIAENYNIALMSCTPLLYNSMAAFRSNCIDKETAERLINRKLDIKIKPAYKGCGCYQSIDIGEYLNCGHNCPYCYAKR